MKNLASKGPPKGPPMKNLVCNEKFGINCAERKIWCSKKNLDAQRKIWMLKEKFGINCASAEAQFGTGRGISIKIFTNVTLWFKGIGRRGLKTPQTQNVWVLIPLPVPNWASAEAQFIPNFSLSIQIFF